MDGGETLYIMIIERNGRPAMRGEGKNGIGKLRHVGKSEGGLADINGRWPSLNIEEKETC